MRNLINILLIIVSTGISFTQELNCIINIDYSLVQTQETQIFTELKANMYDFMNNRTWTEDEFSPEERIKCYINIQLKGNSDITSGAFYATARINSVRPIYGSEYETGVFDFVDKEFNFVYNQSSTLNYSENSFNGTLSSLLSFYAYMVLGFDYDTFSELGGTKYFEVARDIMNVTQSNLPEDESWNSDGDRTNRYYLIDDALSNQMEGLRKFHYSYHRKGMDQLSKKRKETQLMMIEGLKELERIKDVVPISMFVQSFFNAKKKELVNVFSGASSELKSQAYGLLKSLDPTSLDDYAPLK